MWLNTRSLGNIDWTRGFLCNFQHLSMVCPMWWQCLHFGKLLELPMWKRPKVLLWDANVVLSPANKVCIPVFNFGGIQRSANDIEAIVWFIGDLKIWSWLAAYSSRLLYKIDVMKNVLWFSSFFLRRWGKELIKIM